MYIKYINIYIYNIYNKYIKYIKYRYATTKLLIYPQHDYNLCGIPP